MKVRFLLASQKNKWKTVSVAIKNRTRRKNKELYIRNFQKTLKS